ncbi:MAG: hypothetical protein K2J37_05890 [Ruminococcus sp.]|nr:hypothetical protein [Ruminococcus sp.]MDE6784265.1 hypothetical protein [Ruminococcus sp.]
MSILENKNITMKAVKLMFGHYINSVMNAGYDALISGLTKKWSCGRQVMQIFCSASGIAVCSIILLL